MDNSLFKAALAATFVLILTACEMLVEFELPEQEPRMVLFGYHEQQAGELYLFLGSSSGITTTDPYAFIPDADIQIYVNENAVATADFLLNAPDPSIPGSEFVEFRQSVYLADMTGVQLLPGDLVTVRVSATGYESIEAADVVPRFSSLESFEFRPKGSAEPLTGETLDQYILRIKDAGGGSNHYMVRGRLYYNTIDSFIIDSFETFSGSVNISLDWRNLVVEAGYNGPVMTNAGRESSTFDMEFVSYPSFDVSQIDSIRMELHSISDSRFLFERSMITVMNTSGNPFSEPAFLFSNVEGGFGFFSVYARSSFTLVP